MYEMRVEYPYAAAISSGGATTRIATLGNNKSVDTTTQPEDVWSGADLGVLNGIDHKFIPRPTNAAVSMEVVSDSANDAAAGTGARTIVVGYLNASYQAKTQVVTMNGLTPVAIPEAVMRINSVVVVTTGTFGLNNIGNISVRAAGGLGATYSYMQAGTGIARSSLFTVPDQLSYDILSMFFSINRSDTNNRWGTFSLCVQNAAGRLIKGLELSCSTNDPYRHEASNVPLNTVAARTDVWIRCESVSQSGTNVTASLFGIQRRALDISL